MGACGAIEFGRVCKWKSVQVDSEAWERLRAVRVIYPDSMPEDLSGWKKPVMNTRPGSIDRPDRLCLSDHGVYRCVVRLAF